MTHRLRRAAFAFGALSVVFALSPLACGARTDLACGPGPCIAPNDSDDASASTLDATRDGATDVAFDLGDTLFPDHGARDAPSDTAPFDTSIAPDAVLFDTAPPPAGCPAALPADGTPCDFAVDCAYDGCDPSAPDRATCTVGAWVVRSSACASTSPCPIEPPASGTPCTVARTTRCMWSVSCTFDRFGMCILGVWQVKAHPCDVECPRELPEPGTPCTKPPHGDCAYPSVCGLWVAADCNDGAWTIGGPPCSSAPGCPSGPPTAAAPCGPSGLDCAYANGCGSVDSYVCASDGWDEWPGACVDPDCPPLPRELDACAAEGKTCRYPDGGGCELDCTCKGGAFHCTQPPCAR